MAYEQFDSYYLFQSIWNFICFNKNWRAKSMQLLCLLYIIWILCSEREREREKCDVFDIKMLKQEILSKKEKVKENVKVSLGLC